MLVAASLSQTAASTTITYTYDENGNVTSRESDARSDTYTWDFDNRLVGMTSVSGSANNVTAFGYDAGGIRHEKASAGVLTHFITDSNRNYPQVVVEHSGDATTHYVYGNELVSASDTGGPRHYFYYDAHQSTRQMTSATAVLTNTYTYDAFGMLLDSTGSDLTVYRYAGEAYEEGVNAYYLRARYYEPMSGRFLTRDTHPGRYSNPITLHRYLYTGCDPVNHSDPSGLSYSILEVGDVVSWAISILGASSDDIALNEDHGGRAETLLHAAKYYIRLWLETGGPNYTKWFDATAMGPVSSVRRNRVFGNMRDMERQISAVHFYYGIVTPNNPNDDAYTCTPDDYAYSEGPDRVYLCPLFFRTKVFALGIEDSQVSTVIHETSHLVGTDDVDGWPAAYDIPKNLEWPRTDPGKAILNANNYEKAVMDQ